MRAAFLIGSLAAVAALAGAVVAQPASAPPAAKPAKPGSQCFYSHDWQGWKPTPDSKSIYIRVGVNQIYRLDFQIECPELNQIDVHLVTKSVNDYVCSPLDLDLKVADTHGFAVPCILSNITPLTAAEAKALPPKLRP